MNKKIILILALALLPTLTQAEPAEKSQAPDKPKAETRERAPRPGPRPEGRPERPPLDPETAQLFMLGRLIQMEPEQLDNMEKAIAQVRNMSDQEKQEVLEKIKAIQGENRARFQENARRWQQSIPEEARQEYGRRLREMTPEERAEHRKAMRKLTPEERAEAIRKEKSED